MAPGSTEGCLAVVDKHLRDSSLRLCVLDTDPLVHVVSMIGLKLFSLKNER